MENGNQKWAWIQTPRPLMWVTIMFALGAWLGVENAANRTGFAWAGAICACLFAVGLILAWAVRGKFVRVDFSDKVSLTRIALLVAISVLGAYLGANAISPPLPKDHISHRIISGDVVAPEVGEPGTSDSGPIWLAASVSATGEQKFASADEKKLHKKKAHKKRRSHKHHKKKKKSEKKKATIVAKRKSVEATASDQKQPASTIKSREKKHKAPTYCEAVLEEATAEAKVKKKWDASKRCRGPDGRFIKCATQPAATAELELPPKHNSPVNLNEETPITGERKSDAEDTREAKPAGARGIDIKDHLKKCGENENEISEGASTNQSISKKKHKAESGELKKNSKAKKHKKKKHHRKKKSKTAQQKKTARARSAAAHPGPQTHGTPVTIFEGKIVEAPRRYPDRLWVVVEAEKVLDGDMFVTASGRVQVTVMRNYLDLAYGDTLLVKMALKGPANFSNPGGFDYERYLAAQGIFARGSVSGDDKLIVLRQPQQKVGFRERVEDVRSDISTWIQRIGGPKASSEVMRALVVGDRWAVPDETNDMFQRAGVAHLLAVSGLHLGLVSSLVFFITLFLLKSSEKLTLTIDVRKVAAFLTLPPVIAYMMLAGSRLPTIRAAIMICTFMLAMALSRERDMPSVISLAALIILVVWPASIIDPGFVLSFGAVIAIAFVLPLMAHLRSGELVEGAWKRIKFWAWSGVVLSCAIMLFTSPFVAAYFNYFIPVSPITNLIFIPLVGQIALPIGLVACAMHYVWSPLGDWLLHVGLKMLDLSMWLMNFFAHLPGTNWIAPTPTFFETIIVMIITVALIRAFGREGGWRRAARFAAIAAALTLAADWGVWYIRGKGQGDLRVTYLDVGEGNAAVAVTPDGKVLLVDAGNSFGGFDAGEMIIGPYLYHERIKRIDAVVITHPHSDHIGGLKWLCEHFKVGEIWLAQARYPVKNLDEVLDAIRNAGPIRWLSRESPSFTFAKTQVDVWWPPRDFQVDEKNVNDGSMVFRLKYGNVSFLFPGDASASVHDEIFGREGDFGANALLVPHHGARDGLSDILLGRVKPLWAVISSRYSMYNRFPTQETLAALNKAGVPALRTDKLGAVRLRTEGSRIEVRAWDGRNKWRNVP